MLSSVAIRCYWTGRYLERAENMARLVAVYSDLLLDLPGEAGVDWRTLIDVCGSRAAFERYRGWMLERSAVRFLTAEPDNPGSILSSIRFARENLRTLRDVVPREGFEVVNELYLFAEARLGRATQRRARGELLDQVVGHCQRMTGLLAGTMLHAEPYQFIRIGRHLERADMTSRILDVAGDLLEKDERVLAAHGTSLWVNVLRSASAYQAYRLAVRSRIAPLRVVHFLLREPTFPRSVRHCLEQIASAVAQLPVHDAVLQEVAAVRQAVDALNLRELVREALHREMDALQRRLIGLHEVMERTWFFPAYQAIARP
ncbi:MAG: hypothetical protein KatS3mg124_2157 [Porticoccaceae bacterium]|nr:MAG: hypothetical protein KatS3mg124_2157 [Porticoccaceae bacterium]